MMNSAGPGAPGVKKKRKEMEREKEGRMGEIDRKRLQKAECSLQ